MANEITSDKLPQAVGYLTCKKEKEASAQAWIQIVIIYC